MSVRRVFGRVIDHLKEHPWIPVIALDFMVIPGIVICKWLLRTMLAEGKPCRWTLVGAKCATCGGTHCVQSFLQGHFWDSFIWNPMVFCWILYGIVTGVLLNLCFVCNQRWAKSALKGMYSLTAFFVALGVYLLFTLIRNLPLLLELIH